MNFWINVKQGPGRRPRQQLLATVDDELVAEKADELLDVIGAAKARLNKTLDPFQQALYGTKYDEKVDSRTLDAATKVLPFLLFEMLIRNQADAAYQRVVRYQDIVGRDSRLQEVGMPTLSLNPPSFLAEDDDNDDVPF